MRGIRSFAADRDAFFRLPPEVVIGVFLVGRQDSAAVYSVDVDGLIWCLVDGVHLDLRRWCRDRRLRVHFSLGELVSELERGCVVGLLPWLAVSVGVPLGTEVCCDEQELDEVGAQGGGP